VLMESWTDFLTQRRQGRSASSYGARLIQDNVHYLKGKDSTGRRACYFIYVPPARQHAFREALKKAAINLSE
jgi:hypothetical protein